MIDVTCELDYKVTLQAFACSPRVHWSS